MLWRVSPAHLFRRVVEAKKTTAELQRGGRGEESVQAESRRHLRRRAPRRVYPTAALRQLNCFGLQYCGAGSALTTERKELSPAPPNTSLNERKLMNCPKCGNNLPNDARFCSVCGSNLSATAGAGVQAPPSAPPSGYAGAGGIRIDSDGRGSGRGYSFEVLYQGNI